MANAGGTYIADNGMSFAFAPGTYYSMPDVPAYGGVSAGGAGNASAINNQNLFEYIPGKLYGITGNNSAEEMGEFRKGLNRSIQQIQATAYGSIAALSDYLGISDQLTEWGIEGYNRNMEEAAQYPAAVPGFTHINGVGSAMDWAAGTMGELIPTVVGAVGSAGVGSLLTKTLGGKLVRKFAANRIAAEAEKTAAKLVAGGMAEDAAIEMGKAAATKQVMSELARKAGTMSMVGFTTSQEAGSNYGEDVARHGRENTSPGMDLAFGLMSGISEAIIGAESSLWKAITGRSVSDAVERTFRRELVKGLPKAMMQEGGQEAFQEILAKINMNIQESKGLITVDDIEDIINAAAAGALGGAGFHTPTLLKSRANRRKDNTSTFNQEEATGQDDITNTINPLNDPADTTRIRTDLEEARNPWMVARQQEQEYLRQWDEYANEQRSNLNAEWEESNKKLLSDFANVQDLLPRLNELPTAERKKVAGTLARYQKYVEEKKKAEEALEKRLQKGFTASDGKLITAAQRQVMLNNQQRYRDSNVIPALNTVLEDATIYTQKAGEAIDRRIDTITKSIDELTSRMQNEQQSLTLTADKYRRYQAELKKLTNMRAAAIRGKRNLSQAMHKITKKASNISKEELGSLGIDIQELRHIGDSILELSRTNDIFRENQVTRLEDINDRFNELKDSLRKAQQRVDALSDEKYGDRKTAIQNVLRNTAMSLNGTDLYRDMPLRNFEGPVREDIATRAREREQEDIRNWQTIRDGMNAMMNATRQMDAARQEAARKQAQDQAVAAETGQQNVEGTFNQTNNQDNTQIRPQEPVRGTENENMTQPQGQQEIEPQRVDSAMESDVAVAREQENNQSVATATRSLNNMEKQRIIRLTEWIKKTMDSLPTLKDKVVLCLNGNDAVLPIEVRNAIQNVQGSLRGVYWNDHIYLFSDNILNKQDAVRTLIHEGVVHYGLRSIMTNEQLGKFLDLTYHNFVNTQEWRDFQARRPEYFKTDDKVTQAEEFIAYIAEQMKMSQLMRPSTKSVFNRIVSFLRNLLASFGVFEKITVKDIRDLITLSAKNLSRRRGDVDYIASTIKGLEVLTGDIEFPSSGVMFGSEDVSMSAERVRQQYINTPMWHKAPNGEKSNLSPDQWCIVRTPEFKAWFGDWELEPGSSSKVVDKNGEPLVVYHGTPSPGFTEFNTGQKDNYGQHAGAWFSDSKDVSMSYTRTDVDTENKIYSTFLSIRTPVIIDAKGKRWDQLNLNYANKVNDDYTLSSIYTDDYGRLFNNKSDVKNYLESHDIPYIENNFNASHDWKIEEDNYVRTYEYVNLVLNTAELNNADGVIFKNIIDAGGIFANTNARNPHNVYVALDPTQIKSAVDNVGSFNPNNPDIRYSFQEHQIQEDPVYGTRFDSAEASQAYYRNLEGTRSGNTNSPYIVNLPKNSNTLNLNDTIKQQSQQVQARLKKLIDTLGIEVDPDKTTGGEIYNILSQVQDSKRRASEILNSFGIRGAQFAENGKNNYYLFEGNNMSDKPYQYNTDVLSEPKFLVTENTPADEITTDPVTGEPTTKDTADELSYMNALHSEIASQSKGLDKLRDVINTGKTRDKDGNLVEHSLWERIVERSTDQYRRLYAVQNYLKKKFPGIINGITNVYQQLQGLTNRIRQAQCDYRNKFYRPMIEALQKIDTPIPVYDENGNVIKVYTKDDKFYGDFLWKMLDDVLIARHAAERNKSVSDRMRGKRCVVKDEDGNIIHKGHENRGKHTDSTTVINASGMSEAQAARILERYGKFPGLDEAIKHIDMMNKFTLNTMLANNLITKEAYDRMSEYEFYVPLIGWQEMTEQMFPAWFKRSGKSLSTGGKPVARTAKGRSGLPESPSLRSLKQMDDILAIAERNEIMRNFGALVSATNQQGDKSLFEFDNKNPEAVRLQVLKNGDIGFVTKSTEFQGSGEGTVTYIDKNGDIKRIVVHDQWLAKAMRGENAAPVSAYVNTLRKYTGYMTQLMTARNPAFAVTNPIRDLPGALLNVGSSIEENVKRGLLEKTQDIQKSVLKDIVSGKMFKILWEVSKADTLGTQFDASKFDADMVADLNDWRTYGGHTRMITEMSIQDLATELRKELRGRGAVKSTIEKAKNYMDILSDTTENATRFSIYRNFMKAFRENLDIRAKNEGWDAAKYNEELDIAKQKSVNIALECTVNFTKKGSWANAYNPLWAFSSATLQSFARIARNLWRPTSTPQQNFKRVSKFLAGGVTFPLLWGTIARAVMGDDDDGINKYDKIPDYVKYGNLIIPMPFGDGGYIKIPLPYGYNVFTALGTIIDDVIHGNSSPSNGAFNLMKVAISGISPVDPSEQGITAFVPTLFKPIAEIAANVNFSGAPIMPSGPNTNSLPDYMKAWASTPQVYKDAAALINFITGGFITKDGIGALDISPETIEHITMSYTGGIGRIVQQAITLAASPAFGHDVGVKDVPVINRLYGTTTYQNNNALYNRYNDQVSVAKALMREAEGNSQKERDIRDNFRNALSLEKASQRATTELNKIKEAEKALRKKYPAGTKSRAFNAQMELIQKRKEKVMKRFNAQAHRAGLTMD